MGDYTRIKFRAKLRPDTPAIVLAVFEAATRGETDELPTLPDDPFFKAERWTLLLNGASSYFDTPESPQVAEEDGLVSVSFHSSFKNYGDEIDKFLAWIGPYIADEPGAVLGEYEFENARSETLLIVGLNGRIDLLEQPEPDDSADRFW